MERWICHEFLSTKEIGREIVIAQGENQRAEYGAQLLKYLADQLTQEFGRGFDESNLRKMRQFYLKFETHCVPN